MKNSIVTCVTFASMVLMFFGGCAIMDEFGNFQPVGAIVGLIGAFNLVLISRRVCHE